jgi:hypothetical protein
MLVCILSAILVAIIIIVILALGITPVFQTVIGGMYLFTASGGGGRRGRKAYDQGRR